MRKDTPDKTGTRARILDAAKIMFAEQGFKGATTREIAKMADVNECTVFRHFQTKEYLLRDVVDMAAVQIAQAMSGSGMANNDLYKDLMYLAITYDRVLTENEPLIRTFIGEAYRHPNESQEIVHSAWQAVQDSLSAYIDQAKQEGMVRQDIQTLPTIHIFLGIILSGMLRRQKTASVYSTEDYLETALDIFIRGISPFAIEDNRHVKQ